jgi:ankyrin repeat protein
MLRRFVFAPASRAAAVLGSEAGDRLAVQILNAFFAFEVEASAGREETARWLIAVCDQIREQKLIPSDFSKTFCIQEIEQRPDAAPDGLASGPTVLLGRIHPTQNFSFLPLHTAALLGLGREALSACVAAGFSLDPASIDPFGDSPLHSVAREGAFISSARELLDLGADPLATTAKHKESVLHALASRKGMDRAAFDSWIALFTQAGATIDMRDADGRTPFLVAVNRGNLVAIDAFLAAGADIGAVDHFGAGAAHHAVELGLRAVLDRLIAAGAPIDAPDSNGRTPLRFSVQKINANVWDGFIEALLRHGAVFWSKADDGRTPLHFADRSPAVSRAAIALISDPASAAPSSLEALRDGDGFLPSELFALNAPVSAISEAAAPYARDLEARLRARIERQQIADAMACASSAPGGQTTLGRGPIASSEPGAAENSSAGAATPRRI